MGFSVALSVSENRLTTNRMLGDFFFVLTQVVFTTSGSLGNASETRFCTNT
jgi:hypothetical protein